MAVNPIQTPLPADLPEDWTYGQTVAPTGAEAGLSEQHGYNYLMEQVNAAHEGVNAIGEAFDDLATTDQLGGFILMDTSIPTGERQQNTLYGLILANYGGDT